MNRFFKFINIIKVYFRKVIKENIYKSVRSMDTPMAVVTINVILLLVVINADYWRMGVRNSPSKETREYVLRKLSLKFIVPSFTGRYVLVIYVIR